MMGASSSTRRTRAASALVLASTATLACIFDASNARADDTTRDAARQAYDRGAAAYDAGDYARATSELTRADEISASDVALELALKAAVKADDARAAIVLAIRADRRAAAGTLAAAAQAARSKMAGRTGTVTMTCPGYGSCAAKLDGRDVPAGEPQVVVVGGHKVYLEGAGGTREGFEVRVDPDAVVAVTTAPRSRVAILPAPGRAAPEGPPREAGPARAGISPAWFFVGLGVTAVVGGFAIASGLDTKAKHDDFQTSQSPQVQQDGLDAQLRTNLLVGGTAFSGAVTAVLAIFVRWSSASTAPSSAAKAGP